MGWFCERGCGGGAGGSEAVGGVGARRRRSRRPRPPIDRAPVLPRYDSRARRCVAHSCAGAPLTGDAQAHDAGRTRSPVLAVCRCTSRLPSRLFTRDAQQHTATGHLCLSAARPLVRILPDCPDRPTSCPTSLTHHLTHLHDDTHPANKRRPKILFFELLNIEKKYIKIFQ